MKIIRRLWRRFRDFLGGSRSLSKDAGRDLQRHLAAGKSVSMGKDGRSGSNSAGRRHPSNAIRRALDRYGKR